MTLKAGVERSYGALRGPLSRVFGRDGVCTDIKLRPDELAELRRVVTESWRGVIVKAAPDLAERSQGLGIQDYHQLSNLLDHGNIWTTHARTFSSPQVDVIRSFALFDMFDREFPGYQISSAMPPYGDLGRPRINWRLVRPGDDIDLGPIHADYWFDAVIDGWQDRRRPDVKLKIWIPIYLEEGVTGFAFAPTSHLRDYPFERQRLTDGRFKPVLDESQLDQPLQVLQTPPGTVVMFNYNLVHRGANSGRATQTRVSMELALNLPRVMLEQWFGDVSRYH